MTNESEPGTLTPPDTPTPPDDRPQAAQDTWTWPSTDAPPDPAISPAPRLGWRQYFGVAVVAAAAAAVVIVPISLQSSSPAPAPVTQTASDVGTTPRTIDTGDNSTIATIAGRITPSVASVQSSLPGGSATGSAVVYRADGYLITNDHVVANAQSVSVTLPDGTPYDATVEGTDPLSDLAVLKIDASDLPVPTYATQVPAIGETAIAIGSPFGFDGSVTAGIVSAHNRSVKDRGVALVDLVQTDAAINPGNSGGALVNARGEVFGLNTVIATASQGSNGVGFAIPSSTIQSVADQIINDGSVSHAYLGVRAGTVDPQVAQLYSLSVDQGAVISDVTADSPASRAGLQQGDIITAVGDTPVTSSPELAGVIQRQKVGGSVTLTIVRQGNEMKVDATLVKRPANG